MSGHSLKLDRSYNSTFPNLPDLITSLTSRDHWESINQNTTFAKFLLLLNLKHILSLGLHHFKKVEKKTFKFICRWDGTDKLCGLLHFLFRFLLRVLWPLNKSRTTENTGLSKHNLNLQIKETKVQIFIPSTNSVHWR